jgi:hypothetical protein
MKTTMLIYLLITTSSFGSGFIKFTDIHDSSNTELQNYLSEKSYGKMTYYFDEKTQKDGKWELYPIAQINETLFIANVSTVPGIEKKYNYSLLIKKSSSITILDTLGPFYDSYPEEVQVDKDIKTIKLKIINPPEPTEKPFDIFKYKRDKGKFKLAK